MKIKNSYRGEAMSHLLPVSTFRSHGMVDLASTDVARVTNACANRIQGQGTSLPAAERSSLLRNDSFQAKTTASIALMPRTGKPSGNVQRAENGAPRGIPPRSKPKRA